MIRWLVVFFLLCGPLAAQPITIRSGEHPTFSRLVLKMSNLPDWEIGRSPGGYRLRFAAEIEGYNLTRAFEKIPRSRLLELTPMADGSLQLDLGCLCHLRAFAFGPGELVVDVVDGAPPAASPFEAPLPATAAPEPETPKVILPLVSASKDPGVRLPPGGQELPAVPTTDLEVAVDAAREELLLQLSRAAGQGLIAAEIDPPTDPNPPEVASEPPVALAEAPPEPADLTDHIRIETSIDSARAGLMPSALPAEEAARCLPQEHLALPSWGSPDAFARPLADLRAALYNEIDRPRPDIQMRLARHYLYFGFGAEARLMIRKSGETGEEATILDGLAGFFEFGTLPDLPEFRGQTACDGPAALWSLLATPFPTARMEINTDAILLTFDGLPLHQRRLLAPALGRKLTEAGATDTASAVMRAVTRAPGDPGREVAALGAEIARETGQRAVAEAELRALIDDNDPAALEALLALSEMHLDEGAQLDQDLRVLLQAQAFEHRGSELGDRLGGLYARSAARSGDYDAVQLAAESIAGTPPWGRLLQDLAGSSSNVDFLRLAFAAPFDPQTEPLPSEARYAMAKRLISLGFPEEARHWLAPVAQDPVPSGGSETLARLAVEEGRPEEATVLLRDASSAEALRLRAEAERQAGTPEVAHRTLAELGARTEATSVVLRAGDWDRVADTGTEIEQALARLASQTVERPADAPSETPLQDARTLLERSAASRGVLQQALAPAD